MLHRFDTTYFRYDTKDLDDPRIPKFIEAMRCKQIVSFQGEKYTIKCITLTEKRAEILLLEVGE